jgi:hypothetical protein
MCRSLVLVVVVVDDNIEELPHSRLLQHGLTVRVLEMLQQGTDVREAFVRKPIRDTLRALGVCEPRFLVVIVAVVIEFVIQRDLCQLINEGLGHAVAAGVCLLVKYYR